MEGKRAPVGAYLDLRNHIHAEPCGLCEVFLAQPSTPAMCREKPSKSFPQVGHSPSAQMFTGEAKKRQGLHLRIVIQNVIYLQETVIILPFSRVTVDMAGLSGSSVGARRARRNAKY
jgi:hypothetical protein